MQKNELFQNLVWDTEVLKTPTAKINATSFNEQELSQTLETLGGQGIKLVYWSVDSADEIALDAAFACRGVLADKKVIYRRSLKSKQHTEWQGENSSQQAVMPRSVREYRSEQVTAELLSLAYAIGGESRFFLDDNLPRNAYQNVYREWLINSLTRTVADQVFVAYQEEKIAGMVTLCLKEKLGKISLIAVLPEYRGKGLATALLDAAAYYFAANDCEQVEVVTQLTNQAACRLYERYGFSKYSLEYFYHFWL